MLPALTVKPVARNYKCRWTAGRCLLVPSLLGSHWQACTAQRFSSSASALDTMRGKDPQCGGLIHC